VVQSPDALDLDEIVSLQRLSFSEVMTDEQIETNLNAAYYAWTHRPPAGPARIVTLRDGTRLVAMNTMFPLALARNDERLVGWQSCQTATHPSARGRGLFMKCLHALAEQLGPEDIFFGFPNANSTRGFEKLGWGVLAELSTWIRPLPGAPWGLDDLERVERFEPQHAPLLARLTPPDAALIERSPAYLNWRYLEHPNLTYEPFVLDRDGEAGLLVLSLTRLFGVRCALVMELLADEAATERRLLRRAAAWATARRAPLTIRVAAPTRARDLAVAGYAPVPGRWSPRDMVLMGDARGPRARRWLASRWHAQLGDWDAF